MHKKREWWKDKSQFRKMHILHIRNAIAWSRRHPEFLHKYKYWYDMLHIELQRRQPPKKKRAKMQYITNIITKNNGCH
jgi:hypothetical protein